MQPIFLMLILHPATLQNLLVLTGFFVEPLRFSTCMIMSLQTGNFTSSLLIWMSFISFSCLITLVRTSITILLAILFWDLGEKLCFFPIDFDVSSFFFFFIYSLCCILKYIPSIFCWEFLIIKGFGFCQNFFLRLLRLIMWFLSFILLMWCTTLIDFHMLNNPCIPGINLIQPWCMVLLMCCWIQSASILRSLHLWSSEILAYSFLFSWYLCLALESGWCWPRKMSLGIFSLLLFFLEEFKKGWY